MAPQPTDVTPRRLRVLAVDDAAANLMVLASLLRGECAAVRTIDCGSAALEAYQTFTPDLVFMDLSMPVMDGFTAAAAIRQHEASAGLPRTAIIALTAFAIDDDLAARIATSMDGHLSKPVRKADVQRVLTDWGQRLAVQTKS